MSIPFKMKGWSPFKQKEQYVKPEKVGEGKYHYTKSKKKDDKKKQQEIKAFIKKNMNEMPDSELATAVRKKSGNKTEYNWNTETGEVESHDK